MSSISAARRSTHADRREAVNQRLAATSVVMTRLEGVLAGPAPDAVQGGRALDPDGTLRAVLPSIVTLAYRTPGFDVWVTCGPEHSWGVRLRHAPDHRDGVDVRLVPATLDHGAATAIAAGGPGARVAVELAGLIRAGSLGRSPNPRDLATLTDLPGPTDRDIDIDIEQRIEPA